MTIGDLGDVCGHAERVNFNSGISNVKDGRYTTGGERPNFGISDAKAVRF